MADARAVVGKPLVPEKRRAGGHRRRGGDHDAPDPAARRAPGRLHGGEPRAVPAHHPHGALHAPRAGVLRVPHAAADRHRLRPGAQRVLHAAHPLQGQPVQRAHRAGLRHLRGRHQGRRRLRHRPHHLHHHHRRAVHRHHEGRHARRRSGGPLHPGRPPRQADGHRGGVQLGPPHRGGGDEEEERPAAGGGLLRLHGRRLEVHLGERQGRHPDHRRADRRRPDRRHDAPRGAVERRHRHLHLPFHRRRPGHPASRAPHLHRNRHHRHPRHLGLLLRQGHHEAVLQPVAALPRSPRRSSWCSPSFPGSRGTCSSPWPR